VVVQNGNLTVLSGNYNVVGSSPIFMGNEASTLALDALTTTNGITSKNYSFVITTAVNFNFKKYYGTLIRFDPTSTVSATHTWLNPATSAGAEIAVTNNSTFTQTLSITTNIFTGPFGSNVVTMQIPLQTYCKMYSNGTNWVVYQWTSLPQVYTRTNNAVQAIATSTNTLVQFNTLGTTFSSNGPSTWLDPALTYNDSAGTFRFRNPTNVGFYVHIDISLLYAGNATGIRILWIQHSNSTRYVQLLGSKTFPSPSAIVQCFCSTEAECYLAPTESFQVFTYQTSGVILNIQTNPFIQIRRIG
jgi:hypothetical protein